MTSAVARRILHCGAMSSGWFFVEPRYRGRLCKSSQRPHRQSPLVGVALAMFKSMLVELAIYGALKLLQNRIHVFVAICAAFLVVGAVARRSAVEKLPFIRAAGRDLSRALLMSRSLFVAAAFIVAAACGLIAGRWDGWVVTVVTGLALWGVVGSFASLRPPQPVAAQLPDSNAA